MPRAPTSGAHGTTADDQTANAKLLVRHLRANRTPATSAQWTHDGRPGSRERRPAPAAYGVADHTDCEACGRPGPLPVDLGASERWKRIADRQRLHLTAIAYRSELTDEVRPAFDRSADAVKEPVDVLGR